MSALATRQDTVRPGETGLVGSPQDAAASSDLLVVFRLVGQCFGLLASNVREIIHIRATTRVPNTAPHMEGVVNLRGRIVPVFNLQHKLELQGPAVRLVHEAQGLEGEKAGAAIDFDPGTDRRTVMVVEEEGALCGLLVEEVTDVVKLTTDRINRAAAKVERQGSGFVLGTVTLEGGRLVTLLSLEALLAD